MKFSIYVTGAFFLLVGVSVFAGQIAANSAEGEIEQIEGRHAKDMMRSVMGEVLPPVTKPSELPAPDSQGAQLLKRFCIQCHGLPSPGLHTHDEWPAIYRRMVDRMERLNTKERGRKKSEY